MPARVQEHRRLLLSICSVSIATIVVAMGGEDPADAAQRTPFRIEEKQPPGTFVGSIRDSQKQSLQTDELSNISVRVYLPEDPVARLFSVELDGTVLTKERIDRDALCSSRGVCCDKDMDQHGQSVYCLLKFDASVTTVINQRFLMPTISVQLLDLNDHKPRFDRKWYTVNFKETDRVGISVPLPMAEDADWGRNGIVSYRLADDSSSSGRRDFELRVIRDDAVVKGLELVNRHQLDRESQAWHGLILIAEDGGGNTGQTVLNVTIDDVNDCSPEFLNGSSRLTVEVMEDTRPHSVVFSVLAADRDEGQNGRVVYGLRSGRRKPYQAGLFSVDHYSGRVSVNSRLVFRRDEENVYELYVTAYDSGVPRRSSEIEVEVQVIDVNDHSPSIRVQGLTGDQSGLTSAVLVKENAQYNPQIVIATLLASDQDAGENGRVRCGLPNGGDKFGLQFVKQMGGNKAFVHSLFASGSFDREVRASYTLTVECRDHGVNPKRTEAFVRIDVEDVNDSPPVWRQTEYVFSVRENLPAGTQIGRVRAEDADAPPNDIIVYKITDSDSGEAVVSVQEASGQLLLRRSLDREERDRYAFRVAATNAAEPHFSATAQVTLMVQDENDNSPTFAESTPSQVFVMEDAPIMTLVAMFNVSDADEAGNRKFKFSVANEGSRRAPKFSINDLGELTLISNLDREVDGEYPLKITVSDNGAPTRSSVWHVTVQVGDVNDTPPTFVFPDGHRGSSQVNISNSLPPGSLVAKVIARDEDEGANGNLTYRLLPETPNSEESPAEGLFHLDLVTGYLRVQASLLHLTTDRMFVLRVQATDSGLGRRHKREAVLRVLVTPAVAGADAGQAAGTAGVGGGKRRAGQAGGQEPMLLLVLLAAGLAVLLLLALLVLVVYAATRRRWSNSSNNNNSAARGFNAGGGGGGLVSGAIASPSHKEIPRSYCTLPGRQAMIPAADQFIPLTIARNRREKSLDEIDTGSAEKMLASKEYVHQSAFHSMSDLTRHGGNSCSPQRVWHAPPSAVHNHSSGDYSVPHPVSPGQSSAGRCFSSSAEEAITTANDGGRSTAVASSYTRLRGNIQLSTAVNPGGGGRHESVAIVALVPTRKPQKSMGTPYDNVSDV